jgi:DNA-binding NarL/FixJ family response regulator
MPIDSLAVCNNPLVTEISHVHGIARDKIFCHRREMYNLSTWPDVEAEIFVLEDDPRLRARLVALIEKTGGFRVSGQAGNVADGLSSLSHLVAMPDICLIDLGMPDGSGLDVVRAIKARSDAKVLIFTVFGDQNSVISALEAGADGFVLKDSRDVELIDALHATLQGGSPISAAAAAHLLRRLRTPVPATATPAIGNDQNYGLTKRELQTLELLARGFPQREVAGMMNVSPHTVGAHVKSIYAKMAVNSRSEAVFEAVQSGLIDLGTGIR